MSHAKFRSKPLFMKVQKKFHPLPLKSQESACSIGPNPTKVVWAGNTETTPLMSLQHKLSLQISKIPFQVDSPSFPFQPHLTLGRIKGKIVVPDLLAWMKQEASTKIGRSTMDAMILMESQLSAQDPHHIPRLVHTFKKEA